MIKLTCLSVLILALCCVCPVHGEPGEDVGLEEQMKQWWADLEQGEPQASSALLKFSDHPEQSIEFFAERLQPLSLSEQELDTLIVKLSSGDDAIWKPAFEELEYRDPRLAMDLEYLMDKVVKGPARQRLVEIMSGYEPGTLAGQNITLSKIGNGSGYNFRSRGSWWAEHRVERINTTGWGNQKPQWTRACRAIALLEHIGSREALAILHELGAGGHEDAQPTQAARQAGLRVMRRLAREKPSISLIER